jgi:hypothetical protein
MTSQSTDPEMMPAEPTMKARHQCAEWLHMCLQIGWPKSSLDRLEAIWWEFHDNLGRLKS